VKTKGEKLGEAWQLILVAWSINMFCFLATWWVGEYMRIELGMEWINMAQNATLWTLGLAKVILTVMLVSSTLNNFNSTMQ